MGTRLQVLMEESELREIQRVARAQRMTVAEWVRQALRQARRQAPGAPTGRKLDAIRAASHHAFPTADITTMLQEIEGTLSTWR